MPANANPKILHVMKMTGVAGAENHLRTLLPGLRRAGFEPHLAILMEPGHPLDAYAAGMEAAGIPTTQHPIQGNFDLALIDRLRRVIIAGGFGAVHTHLIHADLHGVLAARRAGVPDIYMTGHNDDPFRRRLPIRMVQRFLWNRAGGGIAISEAIRQLMITVEGAAPGKIVTIPYGLDLSAVQVGEGARAVVRQELGLPVQAPVLGSVCRLVEQKGLSDGLRAFWQASREATDAHYVIVGDGPLRAPLEAEAEGYGVRHRVHFLGWRDDAQAIMAAFDALVVPSHWEGFGLVTLEAMAVRLPLIVTNVSALPEIVIDGETGYIVPVGDVHALAEAMINICQYPAQAHQLGLNGRARLEQHYSAEQMLTRTAAFYETHGAGRRRGS